MSFWDNFKDWLYSAFMSHPLYTVTFGGGCFFLGTLLG